MTVHPYIYTRTTALASRALRFPSPWDLLARDNVHQMDATSMSDISVQ